MRKSVGFIGCGQTAMLHADVLSHLSVGISSVVAKNPSSQNVNSFAKKYNVKNIYFDIDEMILSESLDALWVVTPWNTNYSILKKIRKYNIPIFVEKPIACSLAEINDLLNIYQDYTLPFQVGFNRRFYDYIPNLKKQLSNDSIKSVIIEAPESSSEDEQLNNKMLHANTSHLIDLIYFLLGPLVVNYSHVVNKKNYSSVLLTKDKIPIHFISSWDVNANFSIKIFSESKVYHLMPIEKCIIYDSMDIIEISKSVNKKIRMYKPQKGSTLTCDFNFKPGFLNQAKFFINSIDNNKKNQISANLNSTYEVIKICEQIIGNKSR